MTVTLARWIPNDSSLAGLAELFEPAGAKVLAAEIAQEATGSPVDADAGELCYVKYKPTRHCIVQWAFPTPSGQPLLVSATLSSGSQGADVASDPAFRRQAETLKAGANGGSELYRYLPERRLFFQLFPLDSGLPGLPLAASGLWATAALAHALGLSPGTIRIADITPVAYNPWNRWVVRYTVVENGLTRQYYAKMFRDDRGQTMSAVLRSVWERLTAGGASWRIPAPLAFIPEARMLVLEALESATDARSLLRQAAGDPRARQKAREVFERTAGGMVQFQKATVEGLPVMTARALLLYYEKKINRVARVSPELADSIRAQLSCLEAEACRLPTEPMVLCHGAFRHTHVLLCGEKLGLVDLDNLRLSGASADAGDFLAYLDRVALRQPAQRPIIGELETVFVAALRRHRSIDRRWLAWHRSAAHVKWALRSFHSLSSKGGGPVEDLAALRAGFETC